MKSRVRTALGAITRVDTPETIAEEIAAAEAEAREAGAEAARQGELARCVIADGGPITGQPLARAVLQRVERYEFNAWPRERNGPEPADQERAILWRILSLNAGSKMPGEPQLVRILAGIRTP